MPSSSRGTTKQIDVLLNDGDPDDDPISIVAFAVRRRVLHGRAMLLHAAALVDPGPRELRVHDLRRARPPGDRDRERRDPGERPAGGQRRRVHRARGPPDAAPCLDERRRSGRRRPHDRRLHAGLPRRRHLPGDALPDDVLLRSRPVLHRAGQLHLHGRRRHRDGHGHRRDRRASAQHARRRARRPGGRRCESGRPRRGAGQQRARRPLRRLRRRDGDDPRARERRRRRRRLAQDRLLRPPARGEDRAGRHRHLLADARRRQLPRPRAVPVHAADGPRRHVAAARQLHLHVERRPQHRRRHGVRRRPRPIARPSRATTRRRSPSTRTAVPTSTPTAIDVLGNDSDPDGERHRPADCRHGRHGRHGRLRRRHGPVRLHARGSARPRTSSATRSRTRAARRATSPPCVSRSARTRRRRPRTTSRTSPARARSSSTSARTTPTRTGTSSRSCRRRSRPRMVQVSSASPRAATTRPPRASSARTASSTRSSTAGVGRRRRPSASASASSSSAWS